MTSDFSRFQIACRLVKSDRSKKFSFLDTHSFPNLGQLGFFFLGFEFFESAGWVVVKYYQVPVTHVETGKMVASIFCIMNILKTEINKKIVKKFFANFFNLQKFFLPSKFF